MTILYPTMLGKSCKKQRSALPVAKRRERGDNPDNLLDALGGNSANEPTSSDLTATDIANEAYGSQVPFGAMSRSIRARPLPIDQIYPDPMQPRRTIPSAVRHYWNGEPDAVQYLLQMWMREVEIERGKSFDLQGFLTGETEDRVPSSALEDSQLESIPHRTKSLETAFMAIVDLAASIRRDGLTNPITVSQQDRAYVLETGERRWLAYHLLHMAFPQADSDWSKIPARMVEQPDIWRQASENNARDDLNAIARARQFALLLMDLQGLGHFQPLADFEQEQGFYAQVADGQVWRVPRHAGEKILNAMGLKNSVQLRQYRALLSLPDVVWVLADDLNWTESFIRKELRAGAHDENEVIRRAILAARAEGYTVSLVTLYEHLLDETAPKIRSKPLSLEDILTQDVPKLMKKFRKLKPKERRELAQHLRQIANDLES
jgi:hypothetical protein